MLWMLQKLSKLKIIDPFRKEFNESWEQPPKQIELSSSFRQTAQLQSRTQKVRHSLENDDELTKLFYPRANDFTLFYQSTQIVQIH